jgi:hypothetical protein
MGWESLDHLESPGAASPPLRQMDYASDKKCIAFSSMRVDAAVSAAATLFLVVPMVGPRPHPAREGS